MIAIVSEATWHELEIEEVLERLGSTTDGLSEETAHRRRREYGENRLSGDEGASIGTLVLKQLRSPLIYLLGAAAVVSLVPGHYADAAVIAAVIVINTILGIVQEYKAERALESLRSMAAPRATVCRAGDRRTISAEDVVPGDVIFLEAGDAVPADARLVRTDELSVDESMLTGESEAVTKGVEAVAEDTPLADRTDMVYASTTVAGGRATAVVVATGMNTELGGIAGAVQSAERAETPLQQRMNTVSVYLGGLGLAVAALVLVIGIVTGYEPIEMALYSVAVAVSVIPEGLPAVISITLALGVRRMAERNALIRRLPAVETLGSTTVICSDKTGTITANEMTVTHLWAGRYRYAATGEGYSVDGEVVPEGHEEHPSEEPVLRRLLEIGAVANNATAYREDRALRFEGTPTEKALLACSLKAIPGAFEERRERRDEVPFSSDRKYRAVLGDSADGAVAFAKGAPERILESCTHILVEDERIELTESLRSEVLERNGLYADQALRVLAAAYKEYPDHRETIEQEDVEAGLTFVGLWGMIDPPRPDAVAAIADARTAGIQVVMITGDQPQTASAIAHRAGIAAEDVVATAGPEVDDLSDDELADRALSDGVFARVSPAHKLRILNALRARGHVVAMTGDGVNDAPALKGADIGVAMGVAGTEVARQASEMILTDDDFASIVHAVEEGRVIFGNLQRAIFYLLATNIGEVLALTAALVLGLPLPLTAVMILWTNLITDGVCVVPLGVEPSHRDVLDQPPRAPGAPVLDRLLYARMAIVSVVIAAGTIGVFVRTLDDADLARARSMAFATLAAFQWFKAFSARTTRQSLLSIGPFSNRWLNMGVAAAIVLQLLAFYTPVGRAVFDLVHLALLDWAIVGGVSVSVLLADEVVKLVRRFVANDGR